MTDPEKRSLSDKFMLRLPDGMRERIKAAAAAHNRSMNAEIVYALEVYFRLEGLNPDEEGNSNVTGLDPEAVERIERDSDMIVKGVRAARRVLHQLEALEHLSRKDS